MSIRKKLKSINCLYKAVTAYRNTINRIPFYARYKAKKMFFNNYFPMRSQLGLCGKNVLLEYPQFYDVPSNVYIEDNVKLRSILRIINSEKETVTIRKYSVIADSCLLVTNNHTSTVGVPQFLLGSSHVNDRIGNIVIEEDVWLGSRAIILAGVTLGRGCIVGAGSIISKNVPPYAVVVGKGRIIARKFELEDILKHEEKLYKAEERMTREQLEELFNGPLADVKTFGCNTPLTAEQQQQIEIQKEIFQYVEPF